MNLLTPLFDCLSAFAGRTAKHNNEYRVTNSIPSTSLRVGIRQADDDRLIVVACKPAGDYPAYTPRKRGVGIFISGIRPSGERTARPTIRVRLTIPLPKSAWHPFGGATATGSGDTDSPTAQNESKENIQPLIISTVAVLAKRNSRELLFDDGIVEGN